MSKKVEIEVAGKKVMVSNLDKVLYPAAGFTKRQVIDYYIRIAPVLLPHLKNRPITLKRYPDGVDGFFFYEKQCPSHRPDWVKTTEVPSQREEGKIDYCLMNDLPALVWAANPRRLGTAHLLALRASNHAAHLARLRSRSRCTCRHGALLPRRAVAASRLR